MQIQPLPRSIQVAGKLGVLDELGVVDALLHGLSGREVVVCKVQHRLMNIVLP